MPTQTQLAVGLIVVHAGEPVPPVPPPLPPVVPPLGSGNPGGSQLPFTQVQLAAGRIVEQAAAPVIVLAGYLGFNQLPLTQTQSGPGRIVEHGWGRGPTCVVPSMTVTLLLKLLAT